MSLELQKCRNTRVSKCVCSIAPLLTCGLLQYAPPVNVRKFSLYKTCLLIITLVLLTTNGFGQSGVTVGKPAPDPFPKATVTEVRGNPYHILTPKEISARIKQDELNALNGDVSRMNAPGSYYAKYAALLSGGTVNLARLYPDRNCFKAEPVVSVAQAEKCADSLPLLGDGSYYSFRYRSNLNQKNDANGIPGKINWADIQFVEGKIKVGVDDYQQGLIAEIADTPFETLSKNSAEIRFLKDYKMEQRLEKLGEQKGLFQKGIDADRVRYADSAAAKVNSFYVMRSAAYRYDHVYTANLSPEQIDISMKTTDEFQLRNDIIVAFKIVGQEPDGSIIILWKELVVKKGPNLKAKSDL